MNDTQDPRNPPLVEPDRVMLRTVLHAFYWLDDGLQAYMRREAGMSLPRAQSMLMVYLSEGVDRQADLARRLRVSKQAVQQGLRELVAKGMVTIEPDPANGRQKVVRFTKRGLALRDVARTGLVRLEVELRRRIGAARFDALQDALAADWGPSPDEGEGSE